MKKFFVFGLFSLLLSLTGFAAEFSQDSAKLYNINYLNQNYTVQVNSDNTTLANIPGIGICKGKLDGGASVAVFFYFGESSVGGRCDLANINVMEYSNNTLGVVESMRIGTSRSFLGYLNRSPVQIGVRISRIK